MNGCAKSEKRNGSRQGEQGQGILIVSHSARRSRNLIHTAVERSKGTQRFQATSNLANRPLSATVNKCNCWSNAMMLSIGTVLECSQAQHPLLAVLFLGWAERSLLPSYSARPSRRRGPCRRSHSFQFRVKT